LLDVRNYMLIISEVKRNGLTANMKVWPVFVDHWNTNLLYCYYQLSPGTNYRQLVRYSLAHANFLAIFCRRQ
jgi:hypothetical protein